MILLFVVGNLVLVGGQKALHWKGQSRLDEINRLIDAGRVDISQLESRLNDFDRSLSSLDSELGRQEAMISDSESRIESLRRDIDAMERRYASGIPPDTYSLYSQMVEEHNVLVGQRRILISTFNDGVQRYNAQLSRFEADGSAYDERINQFNALVTEGNSLAKSIGTTWYVLPVPRFGGRGHQVAPGRR